MGAATARLRVLMSVAPQPLPVWDIDGFVVACHSGDLARVRELTSREAMAAHRGVDLNASRPLPWWCEPTARNGGHCAPGLYWACTFGRLEVVRHLTSPAMLAAGVDVNKGDSEGHSPLAAAARTMTGVEVVRHLLESPDLAADGITVDANAADARGWTALHWACGLDAPPETVSLLLRQPRIEVDARDKEGRTALSLCDANAHIHLSWRGAEKAALIRERAVVEP